MILWFVAYEKITLTSSDDFLRLTFNINCFLFTAYKKRVLKFMNCLGKAQHLYSIFF